MQAHELTIWARCEKWWDQLHTYRSSCAICWSTISGRKLPCASWHRWEIHTREEACVVDSALNSSRGIGSNKGALSIDRPPFPAQRNHLRLSMAATASSTLLQGSKFSSARCVPRTAGHQRIPSGVGRKSALSSGCLRTGSERRAAVICAAAASDGGAPASALPAALLFDCDGVLVDTEKDGHRISFNETFAEVGHPAPLILIFSGYFAPNRFTKSMG